MTDSDHKKRRLPRFSAFLIRVLLPAAVIVAVIAIQFAHPQFRARIRDNAFDQLQLLAPLPYRDSLPVRVVAIDDASLASIGQWPWPRVVLSGVVEYLAAYALMDAASPEAKKAFQNPAEKYPDDSLINYHAKRLAAGETGSTVVMTEK
jgi:adenylate cyclase